jgi:hypothetical protein
VKGDTRQSAFTENRDVAGAQMANDHLTDEQRERFNA